MWEFSVWFQPPCRSRANHLRGQLLIQATNRKILQQFLRAWQPLLDALPAAKPRCSLDIDPLEF